MKKLKIKWMLLTLRFLFHILWILDDLQEPYKQNGEGVNEIYKELSKLSPQLEEEITKL